MNVAAANSRLAMRNVLQDEREKMRMIKMSNIENSGTHIFLRGSESVAQRLEVTVLCIPAP